MHKPSDLTWASLFSENEASVSFRHLIGKKETSGLQVCHRTELNGMALGRSELEFALVHKVHRATIDLSGSLILI